MVLEVAILDVRPGMEADFESAFRGSPQYPEWRSLLHHYYDPFPEVQHYEPVYGSDAATPVGLMREYEQALASQDWARVEPLLHTDVCVTFASGTFKGKGAVRSAFERNLAGQA